MSKVRFFSFYTYTLSRFLLKATVFFVPLHQKIQGKSLVA